LEASAGDEAHRIHALSEWVRRRLQQIDALISPVFLDLSARSAEVEFEDKQATPAAGTLKAYRRHLGKPELRFWSIDIDKDMATSRTALQWATDARLTRGPRACQAGPLNGDQK